MKTMFSTIGCQFLEIALSKVVRMDPDWSEKVTPVEGKIIALELSDFNIRIYFYPTQQGIFIRPHLKEDERIENEMDVLISGSLSSFLQLMDARRQGKQMVGSGVQFSGDIGVGQHFESILSSLSPEWEQAFTRFLGDELAMQMIQTGENVKQKLIQQTANFQNNSRDYLKEELGVTPANIEMENFKADVSLARSHLARLEARFRKLQLILEAKGADS